MFCPSCGTEVQDGMTACPNCGTVMGTQTTYQQPVYQQPVYQQPVYQQPMDMNASMGASKGNTAMTLGIVSLFLGPIFAIISLIFAGESKRYTGGVRNHEAQVGFVCSWITLGIYIAVVAIYMFIGFIVLLEELSIAAPALAVAAPLLFI